MRRVGAKVAARATSAVGIIVTEPSPHRPCALCSPGLLTARIDRCCLCPADLFLARLSSDNAFNICYSAFYTDCTHEVKPVASGYRLCLVYNLCHTAEGPAPTPAYNSAAVARLLGALAAWEKEGRAAPHKLLYMLEHRQAAGAAPRCRCP